MVSAAGRGGSDGTVLPAARPVCEPPARAARSPKHTKVTAMQDADASSCTASPTRHTGVLPNMLMWLVYAVCRRGPPQRKQLYCYECEGGPLEWRKGPCGANSCTTLGSISCPRAPSIDTLSMDNLDGHPRWTCTPSMNAPVCCVNTPDGRPRWTPSSKHTRLNRSLNGPEHTKATPGDCSTQGSRRKADGIAAEVVNFSF
jgi:hypothetical protein